MTHKITSLETKYTIELAKNKTNNDFVYQLVFITNKCDIKKGKILSSLFVISIDEINNSIKKKKEKKIFYKLNNFPNKKKTELFIDTVLSCILLTRQMNKGFFFLFFKYNTRRTQTYMNERQAERRRKKNYTTIM